MDDSHKRPKRALVILASGAEEMEVTIAVDVLRRAEIDVTLAGLEGPNPVRCSRAVVLTPDLALRDVDAAAGFDVIVLPGGADGAQRLAASEELGDLLREQAAAGRLVAAVCAAPIALVAHGVGAGLRMTSHPSVAAQLEGHAGAYLETSVVEDGVLLTSRGPGTSFAFSLAIVARLCGSEVEAAVRAPMQLVSP